MNLCFIVATIRRVLTQTHLWLGTPLDNARDRKAKGRNGNSGARPGELNGMSKFTAVQVEALRRRRTEGATYQRIADEFDCAIATSWRIVKGITWPVDRVDARGIA